MGRYDDLYDRERPVSVGRSRMKRADRAKQFAPFAALKGYEEAVRAQEVQYVPPRVLSEQRKSELNRILCGLRPGESVTVEYDSAGTCRKAQGHFLRLDRRERMLILEGEAVPIDTIYDLKGEGSLLSEEGC